jgi:signal transduction histidine kinase
MNAAPVKVLLVEDSASDALLLQESLSEAQLGAFDVTLADRWADAARRLQQERFDVLLLDLTLPDSVGDDTLRRARNEAARLPVVVLTGSADDSIALQAVRKGVQDYLVKGEADGRQTARAIHYAIERKRAEETLLQTEAALRESERQLRNANLELEHRVAERTAQLQESIRDLEDFTSSISHDLRAPLRALSGYCLILQEECANCTGTQSFEYIRRIKDASGRMDKLILGVLQYSRLTRSEMPLHSIDVQRLLTSIVHSDARFQQPQAEIHIQEPLPSVLGNEAALTQCFTNLLSNAVKFVAPNTIPQVRIWAEARTPAPAPPPSPQHSSQSGRALAAAPALSILPPFEPSAPHLRLWFADNGIGIPKEAHERIFKLFQRLNPSYEGTGIGLTVVRRIVEKMGGRMGLESEPGHGSRFWIELETASGDKAPA